MFQFLESTLAPWEVSDLDRHLLSYCVSLEVTPAEQRKCIGKGKDLPLSERQKYVRCVVFYIDTDAAIADVFGMMQNAFEGKR
jgi:hypothetical protein